MHTRLIFVTSLALLLSVARAQSTIDPAFPGGLTQGSSQSQADPCQDPLSSQCASQQSQPNGYSSQQGQAPASTTPSAAQMQDQTYGANPRQFSATTYRDENALPNQGANQAARREALPPERLSEFQKFVAETTGQVLPIFGAKLFDQVPSTFAPVDQIPVPANAVVGPGDLLRIRIWGQVNFNADLRVDRSGEIYLPQVGPIHVASLPYSDLDQQLRTAIARVYRNFSVAVELGQIRSIQVYVVGRARRPGTYTVSSLSTLIDALFASGGPSLEGSLRHVQLKRAGKLVVDLDLYDLLVNGDRSGDSKLESGDVIYIPAVGPQVAIVGSVKTPAIYEEKGLTPTPGANPISDTTPGAASPTETVAQLLKDAAGITNVAGGTEISIERMQGPEGRRAESVPLDQQGMATLLHDGDILRVQPRVPRYAKTVTLRGNTANPGRYSWHAGMRLSELFPEREALLTRNYWWQRANAGLPAPEFLRAPALDRLTQQAAPRTLPSQQQTQQRARAEERYRADYLLRKQANPQLQERYDPVNGSLAYETNGAIRPEDASASVDTNQLAQQEARRSDASAQRDATTQNTANAGELTRVTLPAPEIDWRYAVIERLDPQTLKTSLVPFDLGRVVLDHDASQDLELQSGDVVTIFSQADIHVPQEQQTHYVRLEGEFVHAGVYSTLPGESLRALVARAGGFTPGAYLFGSEFNRVSVRAVQQRRLDDYIEKLQLQIERGILSTSASASASAANLAGANVAGSEARELVTRLQQIRATGRIVLNLHAFSTQVANLPDIALEDGDTFYVPSVPSNVSVIGAVYDQNSFLYRVGNRVPDYLHLAGGANRDADRSHPYVIRADGSVLSQALLGDKKFKQIVIQPGDTIVVSEKTFGPSKLRDFLNFSQLFSQLAIGAAVASNL